MKYIAGLERRCPIEGCGEIADLNVEYDEIIGRAGCA